VHAAERGRGAWETRMRGVVRTAPDAIGGGRPSQPGEPREPRWDGRRCAVRGSRTRQGTPSPGSAPQAPSGRWRSVPLISPCTSTCSNQQVANRQVSPRQGYWTDSRKPTAGEPTSHSCDPPAADDLVSTDRSAINCLVPDRSLRRASPRRIQGRWTNQPPD